MEELETYLAPAPGVTCDAPGIPELARSIVRGSATDIEAGIRLFEHVRDTIRYSPYSPYWDIAHYEAPAVLKRGSGYCVQKSALLCALARAVGIPARLGFADIENHLIGERLHQYLGTRIMTFHCYAELYLGGRWVKATPSFERELCHERGWPLVTFDGRLDALLPNRDLAGRLNVVYLRYHFTSPGVPLDRIMAAWSEVYGRERMARWRAGLEEGLLREGLS